VSTILDFKKACLLSRKKTELLKINNSIQTLEELSSLLDKKNKSKINEGNIGLFYCLIGIMIALSTGLVFLISVKFVSIFTILLTSISVLFTISLSIYALKKSKMIFSILDKKKNLTDFLLLNELILDSTNIKRYLSEHKILIKKVDITLNNILKNMDIKKYQNIMDESKKLSDVELDLLEKWFLHFRKNNREAKENSLRNLIKEDLNSIDVLNY